jgi:hypothetical protein
MNTQITLICKRNINEMSDIDKMAWVYEKQAFETLGLKIMEDNENIYIYIEE